MTITLYRREIVIFHDKQMIHRWHEWSFARMVGGGEERAFDWKDRDGNPRSTMTNRLEQAAGSIDVVVPDGSRLAELPYGTRLQCHFDPIGTDAETLLFVARTGEKPGFRLEASSVPEKQPSLFGDDPPPVRNGAYGRRPREDRVTPVVEELRAHAASAAVAEPLAPYNASPVIARAGGDLVADVDQAIAYIRDGRGVVAIRILEKIREALEKGQS